MDAATFLVHELHSLVHVAMVPMLQHGYKYIKIYLLGLCSEIENIFFSVLGKSAILKFRIFQAAAGWHEDCLTSVEWRVTSFFQLHFE